MSVATPFMLQDQSFVQIRLGINPQSNNRSPLKRTNLNLVLFSGVFIRRFPPNEKTTRQRTLALSKGIDPLVDLA